MHTYTYMHLHPLTHQSTQTYLQGTRTTSDALSCSIPMIPGGFMALLVICCVCLCLAIMFDVCYATGHLARFLGETPHQKCPSQHTLPAETEGVPAIDREISPCGVVVTNDGSGGEGGERRRATEDWADGFVPQSVPLLNKSKLHLSVIGVGILCHLAAIIIFVVLVVLLLGPSRNKT